MKQKEIFRAGTFTWSPTSTLPFIATGTVADALDESCSNGSRLEIWQPDFMNEDEIYLAADIDSKPAGFVKDSSRFNRIAWGQVHRDRSHGVIAAGMENGELALWDPANVIAHVDASESLIIRNMIHTGPIRGLDFNPIQTNLLSSGAVNGEVYIWDLNDPSRPYTLSGNRSSKLDEITSIAWNQRVQYVLAGVGSSGYSVVWDLRGKREVAALAYGGLLGTLGSAIDSGMSAVAWHPDNATRLATASKGDISPSVIVWDLRNAHTPQKVLTGHERGVLSLSWCKQDADLLLSCGKDGRALCWNPRTSEIIGELPSADSWAFQVEWCPRNPDLFATAFFSGTIGIHSLQSTNAVLSSVPVTARPAVLGPFGTPLPPISLDQATQRPSLNLKQPPRWLCRPVSVSFGFCGKLVTVNNLSGARGKPQSSVVHLRAVNSEEIIRSLCVDLHIQETSSRILEKTVQQLRSQLAKSWRINDKEKESLNKTVDSLRADLRARDAKITSLEQTNHELRVQLAGSQHKADSLNRIIHVHELKRHCEFLCSQGRIYNAVESLLELKNNIGEDTKTNKLIANWVIEFTNQCVATLERVGDEASNADKLDEAATAYSVALSLSPSTLNTNTILTKWVKVMFALGPAHEALSAAAKFKIPRFFIYRVICDILEEDGRLTEAVECFRQMQNEPPGSTCNHDERAQWELEFRRHCAEKLEKLGDAARDSEKHDEAIGYYSNALLLHPTNANNIILKRSEEVIKLDPLSHSGYEEKHAVLHDMGHYSEAFQAFRVMLSKLEQSPDLETRELLSRYVDATTAIQKIVEQTVRHMPRVLIDTETGRLYDKAQQAAAFEELRIYDELRSLMTKGVNHSRIRTEVKSFYRYAMLSHRWQPNEPLFQQVENTSIYKLPMSPSTSKLQNFCKLVLTLQFKWAWSDTCCVNQLDKGVQQESLVAMFRWYRGSSLTIVHLLGVFSDSQELGRLWKSIWNTRGWTYQEYVASEVVQFYTEDWKPYLGLDVFNHKESPVILSEMEQAMNFATQELAMLKPGFDKAREKLYLASMRQTTREEDVAYSLFGIFNVALPVIYGEGNQAVGRLLEHILTRSDNVTLLAWTGRNSGSQHSYLPADLTVYNQISPPHVPPPIEMAEMDGMVMTLRSSSIDLSQSVALYQRLYDLPPLSLFAGRLRLPAIVFPLSNLVLLSQSPNSDPTLPVYRATTPMLGDVEIKTKDDLSGMDSLLLIHPWISPLLDRDFSRGVSRLDLATRALRLVIRLRQPFGGLLLAPLARVQYRRVATDSLIMVRVREESSLTELMDGVRTVDIQ